jgi:hypothetical protein
MSKTTATASEAVIAAARRLAELVRPFAQGHEECTPESDDEPFGCSRAHLARALVELDDVLAEVCPEVRRGAG